jgi:hypothetical protein
MLIELIYHVVLWLNAFPTKSGRSTTLSPHKIVYRHKLDFTKHCKAQLGTYCKAHNEPTPTITMVTCLTLVIIFPPMGNLQGTYKFFNMLAGKKIKQQKLTVYPMPESIIKKVEQFGKSNARPNTLNLNFAVFGILFEWNNNVNIHPERLVEEDVVLYLSLAAEIPGTVLEQDQPIPIIEDKIKPQGCAVDAAACNANLEPFDVAKVDVPTIICANKDKIDIINDNNNGILSITTIPANNNHNPLILPNTSDPDTSEDKDQNEDKENNKDNTSNKDSLPGVGQEADKL